MLIIFPSGSYYCFNEKCGIFFWGAHSHDAIWHLAIAAVSFHSIPFTLPNFAGTVLSGYNYLLDLFIFILSIFHIPALFTYFKLLPIIWFLLFTTLTIIFARKIRDTVWFVGSLLFFVYFGGSFSYILTLYHHGTIWNSAGLVAQQAGHTLINLQYAFSLIFLLGILILIKRKRIGLKESLLLSIFVAVNLGLKFYAGIISLIIVALFYLFLFLSEKKLSSFFVRFIILAIFTIVSIFLFYNPFQSLKSGSVFSFSPLSIVHPFIEEPELFYLKDTTNARYFLQSKGIGPRLIGIELLTLTLFLIFNFGTRIFGLCYIAVYGLRKKLNQFDLIVGLTIIFSILLTIFFVQKGEWWNTIQFLYYGIFLSNIFVALFLNDILKKRKLLNYILVFCIITLTIPIDFDLIKVFSSLSGPAYLPKQELQALDFLKNQPYGTVLTSPFDPTLTKHLKQPIPLFASNDNSYIAAFSGKPLYVADEMQLRLTGTDFTKRLNETHIWECSYLDKINYIYDVKSTRQPKNFEQCQNKIRLIFNNSQVNIYLVMK